MINILEVDDPKLAITFHMIGPLSSLTPHLDSPLATPSALIKQLAMDELAKAKELNANEGFLLKNLEKDCKLLRRQTRSTGEVFAYYIFDTSLDLERFLLDR